VIAVSNIAWSGLPIEPFLDLMAAEGATGLELAASLIWDEPVDSSPGQRAAFRQSAAASGITVSGLHALLFSRQDLQLLDEGLGRARVIDYLTRTIDLCAELGGATLVLGGPKNRRRGTLSLDEANRRGASALHELGQYAHRHGCVVMLEALPVANCDFISNLQECRTMVARADTPGVRLHIDAGAASITETASSDAWLIETTREAAYFHANDFDLLPPGSTTPDVHVDWARRLRAAGYSHGIGIEMRRTDTPEASVSRAIQFVRATYSGMPTS
jgi:D-psicose/D-tagatose/L-ribulose 3-epimerase